MNFREIMLFSCTALLFSLPLTLARGAVEITRPDNGRRHCTVLALGDGQNDTPNIIEAFNKCGSNATVVFPEDQTYWIGERLHVNLDNVDVEWQGQWLFSTDTAYWRNNSYYIAFQNHRAGFIVSGSNIRINGHHTGGIDGNGDVWYNEDRGVSTVGRPMPFVMWNVTQSSVNNFSIRQSQFWGLNIMNGTNLTFENITCSAFSHDAPSGANWVQNADGFNTMDANNITLRNFVYRGGDDCIAIKPRSFNIQIDNLTCHGGNGIAIGSLGQYLEDNTVENVHINNAKVILDFTFPTYSTSVLTSTIDDTLWLGYALERVHQNLVGHLVPQDNYESEGLPRGGGWGKVRNLSFTNFVLDDVSRGPYITQSNGNNGSYSGTSKMEISDILFRNFTGKLRNSSMRLGEISCSKVFPCFGIRFEEMDNLEAAAGKCQWYKSGTIKGLPGCI